MENDHVSQSDSRSSPPLLRSALMALAPTSASAGGFLPHHHHHHWGHGPGFGLGFVGGGYDGCWQTRRVLTPFGFRWRTVNVCY